MAAVSTMILRSQRLIGEKARGDTLDSNEQVECLAEFNTFLDSLPADTLLCYQQAQESFSLTTNTVSYSIGPGATLSTAARPTKLLDPCFVRDSSNLDSHLEIINADAYGRIVQKSAGTTYPTWIFYDRGFDSSGYGTIYIYPAPIANLTLFINYEKQIGTVSSLAQNLSLPPGYQLFLESNFAIHLAAGQTPISAELAKIARDSKAAIKNTNLPVTASRLDTGIVRGSRTNIITGP